MPSDAAQRTGAKTRKVKKVRPVSDTRDTVTTGRARAKVYKRKPEYKRAVKAAEKAGKAYRAPQAILDRAGVGGLQVDLTRQEATRLAGLSPKQRDAEKRRDAERRQARREQAGAENLAPVLKVLEQTTRPVHAIAGATDAALTGKNPIKAGVRGARLKDKTLFSDVLKHAGAPKIVQSVGGFGLDVAADPTTYVTFGAGSVARKAALAEAERVSGKALKAGMTEEGAATVSRRAGEKALTDDAKGLTVKFAGIDLPGVAKATAKAKEVTKAPGVRKVVKKTQPVRSGVREMARDFRPTLRSADTPEGQFVEVRQAGRRARAGTTAETERIAVRAKAVKKRLKPDEHAQVIDAIERGKLKSLPDHLHEPARFLRDQFRHSARLKRQAGISEGSIGPKTSGEAKGYFPHQRTPESLEAERLAVQQGTGKRNPKPASSKARSDKRRIATIEAETPGRFKTNVPEVYAQHMADTAKGVHQSKLNRQIAESGRPVRKGSSPEVGPGESAYHVIGGRIKELSGKEGQRELKRVSEKGGIRGQYVVLNRKLVDDTLAGVAPSAERSATGQGIDRVTGGWKRLATFTPGFHMRNLIGDTQMGYLGQPGHRLPGNIGQGARALRERGKNIKAQETLTGKPGPSNKTIKVAGKDQPLSEFVQRAEREGVLQSGYIGGELEDLAKQKVKRTGHVKRLLQNRENLMRLATYKSGLDKGLTPAQAADKAAHFHIDYRDLSKVERTTMRRIAPFYTFSSRAIPMHLKAAVQSPGKFANIEKAREETAKAFGYDSKDQGKLPEYQQRNAPFMVKVGGKKYVLSSALPLTTLNETPTRSNPVDFLDEAVKTGVSLTSPAIKLAPELYANYNFFFRKPIEDDNSPLVSAPDYVAEFPEKWKKKMQIQKIIDKRSGKKVWGWNAKLDYLARQPPGPVALGQQIVTGGANRRGGGVGAKLLSGIGGVKSDPYRPEDERISRLFDESKAIDLKMAALRQTGVNAESPTRRYTALGEKQKVVRKQITALSTKRGDKVPLLARKKATKKDPWSGGGVWASKGSGSAWAPKPGANPWTATP